MSFAIEEIRAQRFPKFSAGMEAVYLLHGTPTRLKPEYAFAMIDLWRDILDCAPINLNLEGGAAALDVRGYVIQHGDYCERYEVHTKAAEPFGLYFYLFHVIGVNGSRRLKMLRSTPELGEVLSHLAELTREAMPQNISQLSQLTLPKIEVAPDRSIKQPKRRRAMPALLVNLQ